MKNNLAMLVVDKVIIHEIPKRTKHGAAAQPIYSEVESDLDDELRIYFQNKMRESLLSNKSFDIRIDPMTVSPMPALLTDHFDDSKNEFVEISKKMADHLYDIQDGTNPGGLLAVLSCTLNGLLALGLIKLEKEEGVRLEQKLHDDLPTFDLHVLKDLVLTQKTKVFKLAIFVEDPDEDDYDAAASDYQTGYFSNKELASFFLNKFLGCMLRQNPEISTKHFFDTAEVFINEIVEDPIAQTQYHQHIVSELLSQSPTVSTEDIANRYLPVELRQPFVTHMNVKDVPDNFPKDSTLIEKRLKKTMLDFQSGIKVIAPNDIEEGVMKLEQTNDGKTKLEINDVLEEVRGK